MGRTLLGRRGLMLGGGASLVAADLARRNFASAGTEPGAIVLRADGLWGRLTVTNAGLNAVLLRPEVVVEGLSAGVWQPLVTEMTLVSACDPDGVVRPLADHVRLQPGASLAPPPWRGWSCNGQCERHCRHNIYWGAGPFRFRVATIPDGHSFVSPPFAMPQSPTRPDDAL